MIARLSGLGILVVCGGLALIVQQCGCGPREYAPLPALCYEEPLYTAALLRCVDKAESLEESKACRENVNKLCGIVETTTVKR